jgi:alpha-amylase/alpha-mannosidase (GH57 family)
MPEIALAFLWHQHQPYYPDDVAGENPMPWVRLHGVKDYVGMALLLAEVPDLRCTINLTPSLLYQLDAYAEGRATDRFLQVTRRYADELSEADATFLLDHFFMTNFERVIKPLPRYAELYQLRNLGNSPAQAALKRFAARDLRDLQVWFNLAWTHPVAVERDPILRELKLKGRGYTEADKEALLARQQAILREVVPLHRELASRGQVELTTSPYFHPILPLLVDKKTAREALPEAKLPRHTQGYPEDADVQMRWAIEQHTRLFGSAPVGLWPSEGSVCQAMIPLVVRHGFRWMATDEEVLNASLKGLVGRDGRGQVRAPEKLYRPYRVAEGPAELSVVFRDHSLSDLIGFHYQHSEPKAAADHFVNSLQAIATSVNGTGPVLVPVILDGENCWEHYPGGGVEFLRTLYQRCTTTPGLRTTTLGDHLAKHPPTETLPHLFAGSWISHNFAIWIGHDEDNTAWDALHRTREFLKASVGRQPHESSAHSEASVGRQPHESSVHADTHGADAPRSPNIERAWRELYIAEGSDWFWWYGDDHSSAQDALFDYLFRRHLQNVYLLLGHTPPADLSRPISKRGARPPYTLPRAFLEVKIDGRYSFFEWVGAGRYQRHEERGPMAMATHGPLAELHFGFDRERLLVRVDCDGPARLWLADHDGLRLTLVEPAGYTITLHALGRSGERLLTTPPDGVVAGVEAGLDRVVEIAVPFSWLGVAVGQPVAFVVELLQDGQVRDRAPRDGAITLTRPGPDFEQIQWDV